jgi:hypothetical protein
MTIVLVRLTWTLAFMGPGCPNHGLDKGHNSVHHSHGVALNSGDEFATDTDSLSSFFRFCQAAWAPTLLFSFLGQDLHEESCERETTAPIVQIVTDRAEPTTNMVFDKMVPRNISQTVFRKMFSERHFIILQNKRGSFRSFRCFAEWPILAKRVSQNSKTTSSFCETLRKYYIS